jgi:hypothetical protein
MPLPHGSVKRHWACSQASVDEADLDRPDGNEVARTPDFFARRTDGSGVVIGRRPAGRRPPGDLAKFEATRRACELAG